MCSNSLKASKNLDEMRDILTRICRDYLNGNWKTISADEVQLKRISGGLSNFLYHVSLPNSSVVTKQGVSSVKRLRKDSLMNTYNEPKEVLLRIYGQTHGEQALETVLTDTVVFTLLSERKLGPKLHGIFPGGRIEQYIPARPLKTGELSIPNISQKVAEKMAKIHSLNIPVSKEPEWLWNTMYRWLNSVEKMLNSIEETKPINDFVENIRCIDLRSEVDWLKGIIENDDYPVVFCHNDLQEGNILFKENNKIDNNSSIDKLSSSYFDDSASLDSHFESILIDGDGKTIGDIDSDDNNMTIISSCGRKRLFSDQTDDCDLDNTRDSVLSGNSQSDSCDPELMIIDFEYCAYNYRGFDLANHFIEWTLDYTNTEFPFYAHDRSVYPTFEQQQRFITTYLMELANCNDYVPTSMEIDEIIEEIRCFTLASHLFWTLWSLVNVHQEIEFGYWEYGACRLKEYFRSKDLFGKSKGINLKRKHILDDRQ